LVDILVVFALVRREKCIEWLEERYHNDFLSNTSVTESSLYSSLQDRVVIFSLSERVPYEEMEE